MPDTSLTSFLMAIDYRDPVWIAVAYVCGFIVWKFGLPPLVGFLFAGFALTSLGATGGEFLNDMADLGVTLLLFTIGLKLNIRQLLRPEIWGVATAHMTAFTLALSATLWLLTSLGISIISTLTPAACLLLGFALAFSSTVFAVKVFEDKGGMGAQYGRVSIGVLIVQDIAAVVFLAVSTAKLPSPWAALLVVLLLVGRRLWTRLMQEAGHGELLVLFGLVMALGGAVIFEQVGLKGDLGALFFGVLLAQDRKAGELARALFSLKELMLVGFFLSIGMQVTPTAQTLLLALGLICLLPLKSALFFLLLSRFRLRVRQAAFASLALGNYSEFGLIVTAIAVSKGWLVEDWLVVVAMAVVMSFLIAAPLNMRNAKIFSMLKPSLERLEHRQRLPEDEWLQLDDARVLICGMGRVGSSAREVMAERYGSERILGIEFDEDKVGQHLGAGYRVIQGDSSNPDFWHRFVKPREHVIEQVLLCMPNHESNKRTAEALRAWGYDGLLAAVIRYADEEEPLRRAGVDTVYNMYAEVGGSFARELLLTEEKSLSSRDTEPG